jgi:cell wall assembly regulator SMI1
LPGASDGDLATLEASLGAPLPDELAAILRWHSGQSPEVPGSLEQGWNLMSVSEIAESKKELDSQPHPGWHKGWIPFLEDDGGSHLVVDTTQTGHPIRSCWQGNPVHDIVAPSIKAWLQDFVTALEAGKYHEDPERGTFHRSK